MIGDIGRSFPNYTKESPLGKHLRREDITFDRGRVYAFHAALHGNYSFTDRGEFFWRIGPSLFDRISE